MHSGTKAYIQTIIDKVRCDAHGVAKNLGEPCYVLHSTARPKHLYFGVCNKRATWAGMNGPINPKSLSRTKPRGA